MEELSFLDTLKYISSSQPGLLGVTLALLVAIGGKTKSIFGVIPITILFIALMFQCISTWKEISYKTKTYYSIDCINKKLEALNNNRSININELKIDSCDKWEQLKSLKK